MLGNNELTNIFFLYSKVHVQASICKGWPPYKFIPLSSSSCTYWNCHKRYQV